MKLMVSNIPNWNSISLCFSLEKQCMALSFKDKSFFHSSRMTLITLTKLEVEECVVTGTQMHKNTQSIRPNLCKNTVDRVINATVKM